MKYNLLNLYRKLKKATPDAIEVDTDSGSAENATKLNVSPENDDPSEENTSFWGFSSLLLWKAIVCRLSSRFIEFMT